MPELPEVETVRAGIADHSLGRLVQAVRVVDARSLRRHLPGPAHFETALTGRALRGAYRRGKYLWLTLSESDGTLADEALVVHLGMSGQLLVRDEPGGVSGSDSEARAAFDEQPRHLRVALELGPVGATSAAGATRGAASTSRESTGQRLISGVGNIYADEALWRARLHYAKPARTLSAAQTRELLEAVTQVLRESLAAGGTSFDALYVNVLGESGYFERSLNAYGRAGEPCHRCAEAGRTSLMVREPFQNRSSYRCPHCQRAPRSR